MGKFLYTSQEVLDPMQSRSLYHLPMDKLAHTKQFVQLLPLGFHNPIAQKWDMHLK